MTEHSLYKVLSIAGSDGSGGAGIQADLKTFSALGCYGMSALTALTIQNTQGVRSIYDIRASCVAEQIQILLEDIRIDAIKIGMLHRVDIVQSVSSLLTSHRSIPIVLDPVMVAKSGDALLLDNAVAAMREELFPLATVLTPNLPEASRLLQREVKSREQMERAVYDLLKMGPRSVLVKGGHLQERCDDCLCIQGERRGYHWFSIERIATKNTHGTGCTLSAAIASYLAKGFSIFDATREAKLYVSAALRAGSDMSLGKGKGPVHHFHALWR